MTNKDLIEALIKKEKIFNFTEDTKAFISLALTTQRKQILAEVRGKVDELKVYESPMRMGNGYLLKDDILKELK